MSPVPLPIHRATLPLIANAFPTLHREVTTGVTLGYTGHAPDPRIDAHAVDQWDATRGFIGVVWHYVVLTDGTVEIGRDPRTRAPLTLDRKLHWENITVGVVGGLDPATGRKAATMNPSQEASVEALLQMLADALGVPLEITDRIAPGRSGA